MQKNIMILLLFFVLIIFGCEKTVQNTQSYGLGVVNGDSPNPTGFRKETMIGKYHEATVSSNEPAKVPYSTSFGLYDYPLGDPNNPLDTASQLGESKTNSKSTMVITIVRLFDIYRGGTVKIKYISDIDNSLIYEYSTVVPYPDDEGYEYWKYYYVWATAGNFPKGINKIGNYHVSIESPFGNEDIPFTVNGCTINSQCGEQNCVDSYCQEVCVPNCINKKCGEDGCGGSCGICPSSYGCSEGNCVYNCVPNCENKNCGDDGCGGSCGVCEDEPPIEPPIEPPNNNKLYLIISSIVIVFVLGYLVYLNKKK